jgi:hypothetical protein
MSSSLTAPATERATTPHPPKATLAWLHEPLLHFIVAGGLLFAVDHFVVTRSNDPRTIIVGAEVDNEAREVFTASRGHAPNAAELKALRQVWLDNEVLYREGLALGVDRGDKSIRERVIFKALSVIDAGVKLPPVDEQKLRVWFEARREKYDEPARYDFEEAALAGPGSEAEVRGFVAALNAGTPGDAKAGLRVFKGRPLTNVEQGYGADFARELGESVVGRWEAFKTSNGWRAMRLNVLTPAKPAVFEALTAVVFQDWKDAVASEQRTAAVRVLAKKYKIKIEAPAQ